MFTAQLVVSVVSLVASALLAVAASGPRPSGPRDSRRTWSVLALVLAAVGALVWYDLLAVLVVAGVGYFAFLIYRVVSPRR